jgi:hypothetical protein
MMAPKVEKRQMSRETFSGLFEWLGKTPEVRDIHLMGGEPTLNPDFEWFVSRLLERDYRIKVFSNLATEQAEGYADKLADLPVRWVVNVNSPSSWSGTAEGRIRRALRRLGRKAVLTFNVAPDGEDEHWAIDLVREYGLGREIKVGFVLPTVTGSNCSLTDGQYPVVAGKVVRLAREAEAEGIRLDYECGVPVCTFTEEQLGVLWDTGSVFGSGCCSRLDITPDGGCIYCLPLATKAVVPYTGFETYRHAREWFERKWEPYRRLGNTRHCHTCNLMTPDGCRGGCLARMLLHAKNV